MTSFSEKHCKHVSSRGILKSCDVHSSSPISSVSLLHGYENIFGECPNGSSIYVCNNSIKDFVLNMHLITYKFVLVSGDSDNTIPVDVIGGDALEKFLNNDNLIHWFSQNCISDHPKVSVIPIGMDYHSISSGKREWGSKISPEEQERELDVLMITSIPFYKRKVECFSNFHFAIHPFSPLGYLRSQVIDEIPSELVFYQPTYAERLPSWKKQLEYAFVLSPCGMGIDCHRTWEALALGCIPIVKKSPIDSVYDGLPVLIVDNWSDITIQLLENTIIDFKDKVFSMEKLSLEYWMNKIREIQRPFN